MSTGVISKIVVSHICMMLSILQPLHKCGNPRNVGTGGCLDVLPRKQWGLMSQYGELEDKQRDGVIVLCTIREYALHWITLQYWTLLYFTAVQYNARLCSLLWFTAIICMLLQFPAHLLLLLSIGLCLMDSRGCVGIVRLAVSWLSTVYDYNNKEKAKKNFNNF